MSSRTIYNDIANRIIVEHIHEFRGRTGLYRTNRQQVQKNLQKKLETQVKMRYGIWQLDNALQKLARQNGRGIRYLLEQGPGCLPIKYLLQFVEFPRDGYETLSTNTVLAQVLKDSFANSQPQDLVNEPAIEAAVISLQDSGFENIVPKCIPDSHPSREKLRKKSQHKLFPEPSGVGLDATQQLDRAMVDFTKTFLCDQALPMALRVLTCHSDKTMSKISQRLMICGSTSSGSKSMREREMHDPEAMPHATLTGQDHRSKSYMRPGWHFTSVTRAEIDTASRNFENYLLHASFDQRPGYKQLISMRADILISFRQIMRHFANAQPDFSDQFLGLRAPVKLVLTNPRATMVNYLCRQAFGSEPCDDVQNRVHAEGTTCGDLMEILIAVAVYQWVLQEEQVDVSDYMTAGLRLPLQYAEILSSWMPDLHERLTMHVQAKFVETEIQSVSIVDVLAQKFDLAVVDFFHENGFDRSLLDFPAWMQSLKNTFGLAMKFKAMLRLRGRPCRLVLPPCGAKFLNTTMETESMDHDEGGIFCVNRAIFPLIHEDTEGSGTVDGKVLLLAVVIV